MTWYLMQLDEGILGEFRTKAEARVHTIGYRTRRLSPGAYEYTSPANHHGYCRTYFIATEEGARLHGFDWAFDEPKREGRP